MLSAILPHSPTLPHPRSHPVVLTSMDDSISVFEDGKLKPGIYKIQNIVGQTYLEVRDHSKQLCCRSATTLKDGNGLVRSCLIWFVYCGSKLFPVGDMSFRAWIHHTQGMALIALWFNCSALNETMQLEPGKPDQFCMMLDGLGNGTSISVAAFPVAWRVEVVNEKRYRGWDYVR